MLMLNPALVGKEKEERMKCGASSALDACGALTAATGGSDACGALIATAATCGSDTVAPNRILFNSALDISP